MAPFKATEYGFRWGAAEITRLWSDDKTGAVTMELKTAKANLQLYITKTGKVRVFEQGKGEITQAKKARKK